MSTNSKIPYALVYKTNNVYTIYATFDDAQLIFYWNEHDQAQHKHPIIRDSKKILDQCSIKVLSRFGCQLDMWGHLVEFKFDHSKKLKDEIILWHGPIIDTHGDWEYDKDFVNNSPTSAGIYNGYYDGCYDNHYNSQDDYEDDDVAWKMTMGIPLD